MKATILAEPPHGSRRRFFRSPAFPRLAGHDAVIPFPEELTIRMETESHGCGRTAGRGRPARHPSESVNQAPEPLPERKSAELQAHSSPDEVAGSFPPPSASVEKAGRASFSTAAYPHGRS